MPPNAPFAAAMQRAVAEARLWLGATSPNPPVGATALDKNGEIIGIAAHHHAGGAHAEALLINDLREHNLLGQAETLCVTLEPCNHHGLTPPCTEAIIAANIKRVVIGARDPNPHVTGGGIERLQEAGIEVITDVENEACRRLIHVFAFHATTSQPFITVKRAFDSGSMIPPYGQTTFTAPESLHLAHRLRKKADAIITGSGTILADNPQFTVRHVNDHTGKHRWLAVLDRRGRVGAGYITAAARRRLDVIIAQDIGNAIADLTARGARDILVEAGPTLSQSMLDAGFWTMCVDIHKGTPDAVKTNFNLAAALPFSTTRFDLSDILPL